MYVTWLGCSSRAVFSSVLSSFSDKRGAEISQNLHQIVELISRIEGLLQSWSSIPLQVTSVCSGIFKILAIVVCWSKGLIVDKQVDNVKRHCQSAVDVNPERPDWPTCCHCFVCVLLPWPKKKKTATTIMYKIRKLFLSRNISMIRRLARWRGWPRLRASLHNEAQSSLIFRYSIIGTVFWFYA